MPKFATEEDKAEWKRKCADTRAKNKLKKLVVKPELATGFQDASTSQIPIKKRQQPAPSIVDLSPLLEAIDSKMAELQQQRRIVLNTIAMVTA